MWGMSGDPHHRCRDQGQDDSDPAGKDATRVTVLDSEIDASKAQAGNTDDGDPKPSNVWTGNKMTSGWGARP